MKLTSLSITGFRNLNNVKLEFDADKKIFAFTGPNGHGKTNILEAIFLLAISKSFRTNENLDLIGFDADYCTLSADVLSGDETTKHELIITREPPKKTL